jgi:hypothetical protein
LKNKSRIIHKISAAIIFVILINNLTAFSFVKTAKTGTKLSATKASAAKANVKTAKTVTKPSITKVSAAKAKTRSKVKLAASRGTAGLKYGELLDWWTSASKIFSRGKTAVVTDLYTGRSFNVMRTMGTNHADCEALTKEDTDIIKSIWGGFSWDRRPVIVNVDGRRIAASMSAMPHAGIDSEPAYKIVNNRSDNYGTGENLDVIKNNGMNGHFDIHFLNSTRHSDDQEDPEHQHNVLIAAGR